MNRKMKILCVCALGMNRSKYCANWLSEKGFETQFGGVDKGALNPLTEDMILWADAIVIARDRHKELLNQKFVLARKKTQYVLGVSDSLDMVPTEYKRLLGLPDDEFHKEWTYPHLETALNELLPRLQKGA